MQPLGILRPKSALSAAFSASVARSVARSCHGQPPVFRRISNRISGPIQRSLFTRASSIGQCKRPPSLVQRMMSPAAPRMPLAQSRYTTHSGGTSAGSPHATTLKIPESDGGETRRTPVFLFAFIGLSIMAVVGYDVYYYLYLHEDAQGDPALNPKRFLKFQLNEVIPLTSDTSLFRFQMNMPLAMVQQIPVPCSVIVKDHTCQIGRHYSPISWDYDHFDLIVKKYPDGAVSQFIHSAVPGDKIEICGAFETWKYQPGDYDHIAMIAGGTGVTPCYQLIKKILKDPSDNTQISLIYANRTEADILLRSELEFLTNKYPDQIKVYHTVETGTTWSWKQGKGYINEKMVQQMVPSPDSDKRLQILVCGPEGMMRHVSGTKGTPVDQDEQGPLGGILAKLGYTAEQVYKL